MDKYAYDSYAAKNTDRHPDTKPWYDYLSSEKGTPINEGTKMPVSSAGKRDLPRPGDDAVIDYGFVSDKEAQLLDLLRMHAEDATPPKGVPKTFTPKKDGKTFPKEKLKKLSPKQKAALKAKTDGKVDKTKDGIDTFFMEASASGNVKDASPGQSKTTNSSGSSYNGSGGERGTPGMNQGSNGFKGGTGNQGTDSKDKGTNNASRESQGNISGTPSRGINTPTAGGSPGNNPAKINVQPGDGSLRNSMTQRDAVRAIGAPASPAAPKEPDRSSNVGVIDTPRLSIDPTKPAAKPPDLSLDDLVGPVTKPERALMNKVKQPTSYAKLDSPSSLEGFGKTGSMFDSPLADRPGVYNDKSINDVVGGNTQRSAVTPKERDSFVEHVGGDPTGRVDNVSSLADVAGLTGVPDKFNDRIGQEPSTLANNYAAYRSPPSQPAVEAARAAILGDVAEAAGTITAPYNPSAPAVAAGTLTAPYDPTKSTAQAAGTPTAPYNPAAPAKAAGTPTEAYNPEDPNFQASVGRYGLPTINPASYTPAPVKAAGTLTTPYNPTGLPDSPLSPLATAKPRALGVDKYGIGSSLGSLAMNAPANANDSSLQGVNDSTTADQSLPGGMPQNNSTIADQSLPGGLPSTRSAPQTGPGGQGTASANNQQPVTAPPVTPPPPVVEQTDPYAGIMPWDHVAYDAIKASYEGRGQTYTPQQFITSFYNQRQAA